MGLRFLVCLSAALATACGQSQQPQAYQPPIALGAAPVPSASHQNSYQPPISLVPANAVPGTTYQSGPHTYVLQPLPHNRHQPVQYVPPAHQQFGSGRPATSYSVQQSQSQGLSSSSISVLAGPPQQSTAERTYSSSSTSKVAGSSHVPAQAIHKAPASEIQGPKDAALAAKEKDKAAANDEYVVYYYYYYDNETAASNNTHNPSLNFDDIPSLEAYDNNSEQPKQQLAANSIAPPPTDGATGGQPSSQPRSVEGGRPVEVHQPPVKPVPNVFRYGSNEVPRFPVLPNFVATEAPTTARPESVAATEAPLPVAGQPDLRTGDDEDEDDLDSNSVLDNGGHLRSGEEQEPTTTTTTTTSTSTTTTTTTTEPPTTTEEEPTTTTERSRRRNPIGGGRRRFNPTSSFSSSRNRPSSSSSSGRSTSSTTSTTSTTTSAPTRRTFQGNRIRPRPPIGSNRPRPGSRTTASSGGATTEAGDDRSESTTSSSTTARSRFTSAAPRRFQSSRSRSSSSASSRSGTTSSTTSTTTTTRSPISRSRPAPPPASNRPRPNLISRNRPPRPGFFRPRPGSEPEEPDTTTQAPPAEETSPVELPSTGEDEENETDRDNETDETEEEEDEDEEASTPTTTTEANRFSALFRPRNRNALGNRPRPVIGNRPSRS